MKFFFSLLFLYLVVVQSHAQNYLASQPNLIIITTDGFRWQELYEGMDASIASNSKYNRGDSAYIFDKYFNNDAIIRRRKLMPFFWSTILQNGMLFGNRNLNNNVNVENPYRFSYPGYSEIFTGYADTLINSNSYKPNPNSNFMAFVNQQKNYKNKVIAFGAWHAFDRILNQKESGFPVINAFESVADVSKDDHALLLADLLKDSYKPFKESECLDVFTHYQAFHYLKTKHPKLLFIGYGETDEWAHAGNYLAYLEAAHQVDQWIADIWNWVQKTPGYKNNTYLLITTDHGRGFNDSWTDHGEGIDGASSIWFALLGPQQLSSITGLKNGEQNQSIQFFQKQFAATMCKLIGLKFKANHPVGNSIY